MHRPTRPLLSPRGSFLLNCSFIVGARVITCTVAKRRPSSGGPCLSLYWSLFKEEGRILLRLMIACENRVILSPRSSNHRKPRRFSVHGNSKIVTLTVGPLKTPFYAGEKKLPNHSVWVLLARDRPPRRSFSFQTARSEFAGTPKAFSVSKQNAGLCQQPPVAFSVEEKFFSRFV